MANNNNISKFSLTILRLALGFIFAYHGYLKLFAPGGFNGTIGFFTSIGIPWPIQSALVVSVVEFFGGALLILGVLSRWSSALLIINMLVALFAVHLKNGFLVSNGGYEFVLILLAGLLVVLVNGPGSFSIGKKLFKKKSLQ